MDTTKTIAALFDFDGVIIHQELQQRFHHANLRR